MNTSFIDISQIDGKVKALVHGSIDVHKIEDCKNCIRVESNVSVHKSYTMQVIGITSFVDGVMVLPMMVNIKYESGTCFTKKLFDAKYDDNKNEWNIIGD